MAVIVCNSDDAPSIRRTLRRLALPGQRRLHMRKESPKRQRQIKKIVDGFGVECRVFKSVHSKDLEARRACIVQLADFCTRRGVKELVIEADEGFLESDRKTLAEILGSKPEMRYRHELPNAEPMLWLADVYAWAASRNKA